MPGLVEQTPKYRQLKRLLVEQIDAGRYAPGARIASENELVREYGVSKHTVLKALTELVSEGALYREQGRGTFVAGTPGRKAAETGAIGVVVPILGGELTLSPAFRALAGISQAAEAASPPRRLLLSDSAGDPGREADRLEELRRERVAGVLLQPCFNSGPRTVTALNRLRKDGIPFVLVDHVLSEPPADFVGTDDRRGAAALTEHLFAQGHRRIAHVTLPKTWYRDSAPARDRAAGYRDALQAAGVAFDERWFQHRVKDTCTEALRRILRCEPRPTALFAVDAFTAFVLYREIRARGLRIPEDLALAGFDDVPAAAMLDVPLTMMEQDFSRIGALAFQRLGELIRNVAGEPRSVRLEPMLRARRSTGVQGQFAERRAP